ncbi:MAG: hypothetical protein F6K19_41635 [Cyanothece sp. SIO1E1]|nr:hypothetical protein [Cyanothece sp. SIO1E1]
MSRSANPLIETKMTARQPLQTLQSANLIQSTDNDEGGLDLGQVSGAIRRRAVLVAGVTTAVASAAMLKALTDTPIYQAGFEILTEPVTLETRIISATNPEALSNQEEVVAVTIDETQIKILESPRVIDPVVEQLQERYPDFSYKQLVRELKISANGDNILEVSYTSPDPQLVSDVLDLIADAYLEFSLQERQSDILRGMKFVDAQLPKLRSRVELQQDRLEQLRQQNNLIDPEAQGLQLSEQVGTFVQQQLETQAQLNEARLLHENMQIEAAQQQPEWATGSAFSEDSRYQRLLDQLLEIDSQLAEESVLFLETSPEIQILQDQRRNLLPLLQRERQRVQGKVVSRMLELETRDQALTQTIALLNQRVKQLSSVTRDYTDIQRELQIATDNLNQFLSTREALRIDAAQREVPWQLLTQRGDPQASAASLKQNLILGTVLGLLLGLGTALFVDRLTNILHASKDDRIQSAGR